jgi:hypothetical protein
MVQMDNGGFSENHTNLINTLQTSIGNQDEAAETPVEEIQADGVNSEETTWSVPVPVQEEFGFDEAEHQEEFGDYIGLEAGADSTSFGAPEPDTFDLPNENPENDLESYQRSMEETTLMYSMLVTQAPEALQQKILSKIWRTSILKKITQRHRIQLLVDIKRICADKKSIPGFEDMMLLSLIRFLSNGMAQGEDFPDLQLDPETVVPSNTEHEQRRCFEALVTLKKQFLKMKSGSDIDAKDLDIQALNGVFGEQETEMPWDKNMVEESSLSFLITKSRALTQQMKQKLSPLRFNACVEQMEQVVDLYNTERETNYPVAMDLAKAGWDQLVDGLKGYMQTEAMGLIPKMQEFLLMQDNFGEGTTIASLTERLRQDRVRVARQQDVAVHVLMNGRRRFINQADPDLTEEDYAKLSRKRRSSYDLSYRLAVMLDEKTYLEVYNKIMRFELSAARRDVMEPGLIQAHVDDLRERCLDPDNEEFNSVLPGFRSTLPKQRSECASEAEYYSTENLFYFEHLYLARHEALCRDNNLAMKLTHADISALVEKQKVADAEAEQAEQEDGHVKMTAHGDSAIDLERAGELAASASRESRTVRGLVRLTGLCCMQLY